MSVIAKMRINKITNYGSGQSYDLSCVCSNNLMTAYATSDEDKLFTKYSPWGEMKLHLEDWVLGKESDTFYVMLMKLNERGEKWDKRNIIHGGAMVYSLLNLGDGQAQKVDIRDTLPNHRIKSLSWIMSVDNPAALNQFIPGTKDYVIGFLPAIDFETASEAAAEAHR